MGPERRGPQPLQAQRPSQQILTRPPGRHLCSHYTSSVQPNKEFVLKTAPLAADFPSGAGTRSHSGSVGASPRGRVSASRAQRRGRGAGTSLGASAALGAQGLLPAVGAVSSCRHGPDSTWLRLGRGDQQWPAVASRRPAPAGGAAGRLPGAALAAATASLSPARLWRWCRGRAAMDRNPSPPSSEAEEEGDAVGNTVYSKHWLFSILTRLIEVRA